MARAPAGTGRWLAALDFHLSLPTEIAIIGPTEDPATKRLMTTVFGRYLANRVVVGGDGEKSRQPLVTKRGATPIPLLESRGIVDGKPTAYVCENYACQLPVTDSEELAAQLSG